jgi:hypothetical protein
MSVLNDTTAIMVQPVYPPRPIQSSIVLFVVLISIPCVIFVF